MDFTIDQPQLLAALALADRVADRRKPGQPILGFVLLRAGKDNTVSITATDLIVSAAAVMPAEVAKAGALAIDARYLYGVIKTLPAKPLRLTALDNMWLKVSVGKAEFKLMGQSPSEFPELPTLAKSTPLKTIAAASLADLIDKVGFSVCTDDNRVNLSGVLFECDGKRGTMVSTDGHRLTRLSLDLPGGPVLERGVIIPRAGMLEIKRILDRIKGDVSLAIDGGNIYIKTPETVLSVKLSNVVFPPYDQVIPKEHDRVAVVDRIELLEVLRRAEVMAPEKTATVKLTLTGPVLAATSGAQLSGATLTIIADNPDLGVASQEVECTFTGADITAGFNARYMIELIDAIEATTIRLEFQAELDPCVIKPTEGQDYLGVVMPMRI
jgi:DNA polymerase-3 subunit beta